MEKNPEVTGRRPTVAATIYKNYRECLKRTFIPRHTAKRRKEKNALTRTENDNETYTGDLLQMARRPRTKKTDDRPLLHTIHKQIVNRAPCTRAKVNLP